MLNSWGGPESATKRELFAGFLVEHLAETAPSIADAEYIEEMLLQIMVDEFEVVVEDDSAEDLAKEIVRLRKEIVVDGGKAGWEALEERWRAKGGKEMEVGVCVDGGEQQSESGSDGEDEDGDGDVEMGEAPVQERRREPVVPEVDEDGFTKVTKKKR